MEEKENYSHHNRHNNMYCNICYSFTNIGAMEMNLKTFYILMFHGNEKDSEKSDNYVKNMDLFIMLVSWKLENYCFN